MAPYFFVSQPQTVIRAAWKNHPAPSGQLPTRSTTCVSQGTCTKCSYVFWGGLLASSITYMSNVYMLSKMQMYILYIYNHVYRFLVIPNNQMGWNLGIRAQLTAHFDFIWCLVSSSKTPIQYVPQIVRIHNTTWECDPM
jgi:hypothetical protein